MQDKHTERLDKLAEENDDSDFKAKDVGTMNRQERRGRIKYYKDLMKKHKRAKPKIDIDLEDQAAYDQQMNIQRWATRFGILLKKLDELGVDTSKMINR
tara:strand:+ start:66 stop:362 length:297 start_codon:yes stop_codon:yes gene_type:complete